MAEMLSTLLSVSWLVVALVTTFQTIGLLAAESSDRGGCGKSFGEFEGYSWVYHATGRNCDMAVEAVAIEGAIKQTLRTTNPSTENQLCNTRCFDLTGPAQGALWNGFLLTGPTDGFNASMYCGPKIDLTSTSLCISQE